MRRTAPTWVACLTPAGRGAVATLRIGGPDATRLVSQCLSLRGAPLTDRSLHEIVVARWGQPAGEEVVVARLDTEVVEIHCHGGDSAWRAIVGDLTAAGAKSINWQDVVTCETSDPLVAAARIALAEAATFRTARILLDQVDGAFSRAVAAISESLDAGKASLASRQIDGLLHWSRLGARLTRPWFVVLTGAPNVGKSSLMNALVGFRRAIVVDEPGTTRDVLTADTAVDGWPIRLHDTAGIGAAGDPLESAGIERAVDHAAAADLVVCVFDRSRPWTNEDQAFADRWPNAIHVQNKSDLPPASAHPRPGLAVSARTGDGLDELLNRTAKALIPQAPPAGAAIPFLESHVKQLSQATNDLADGDTASARDQIDALISPQSAASRLHQSD